MSRFYMGIDVGSLSTDGVIISDDKKIVNSIIIPTGASILKTISRCRKEILLNCDLNNEDVAFCVSTGYGRKRVDYADTDLTEITAHGLGALEWFPDTRTVIDIGGQDTKVIKVSQKEGVEDFVMNDRCAAGTGRFIEVMARLLETDLEEMAQLALEAEEAVPISSTCTVFVESEIISLIAESIDVKSIAAGVFESIAGRIVSMVKNVQGGPPYTLSGGVAKNRAMVAALKKVLKEKVTVPTDPQVTGAFGAAVYAQKKHKSMQGT